MAGDFKRLLEEFQAKPLYDEEEAKAAQAADRQQARGARVREGLGGVSDALYSAFTRTPVAPMRNLTALPSAADALANRQRGAGMEQDRRLRIAEAGHRVETDEGKRAQAAQSRASIEAVLPDVGRAYGLPEDVLGRLTPDNMEAVLGAQGAKLARDQAAKKASAEAAERARQAGHQQAQLTETQRHNRAMEGLEGQRSQPKPNERGVTGYDFAPGQMPNTEGTKKMQDTVASASRMRQMIGELETLHQQHGTEYGGDIATRMAQLHTQIGLEAKNIADLGALTGPDMEIIRQIQGADPTSLMANIRGTFGVDNTASSLAGLDRWLDTRLRSNASAYGYAPRSGSGPPGTPAPAQPPRQGGTVRVRFKSDPSGAPYRIPADKVDDSVEVIDG